MTGDTDAEGKNVWTPARGAIFMANIGDTDRRCSLQIKDKTPDNALENCHDASDNTLRNSRYLAPLRTLPVQQLSDAANGFLLVSPEQASPKVRLFHKIGNSWAYVGSNYTFTAEDLRNGLEIGIDGRDVRRPKGWDGKATVTFVVNDGSESAKDSVALRVAPVLTHHHLQDAEQLLAVAGSGDPVQSKFVTDLGDAAAKAGVKKPIIELDAGGDIWAQDFFEPGYTSMPGPGGPVVLHIMIRSCQNTRSSGRLVFTQLRSATVGAVQWLAPGASQDSTGNLDTIPPYSHNGKHYPAGRAYMGIQDPQPPYMLEFLDAQEAQSPVRLDTSWLYVGHVDEFMHFLPVNTSRGWALVVDDPLAAVDMFKKLEKNGHGNVPFLSRPVLPTDPPSGRLPNQTVSQVLAMANLTGVNQMCADRIEANIKIIKQETGLQDDEIFRVPGLYYDTDLTVSEPMALSSARSGAAPGAAPFRAGAARAGSPLNIIDAVNSAQGISRRATDVAEVLSVFNPAVINGVVVNKDHYIAPNPWGPVVDGKDQLATEATAIYGKLQKTVHYIDDWYSHHIGQGEVHCGSNTIRTANEPWW